MEVRQRGTEAGMSHEEAEEKRRATLAKRESTKGRGSTDIDEDEEEEARKEAEVTELT